MVNGIAFGNQYINNLLSQRISLFLSETQVLWDQNWIHQLPPKTIFLFVFSIVFHNNHLSQHCKWKSFSHLLSLLLHFRHWIEHQAQCILPKDSPRAHLPPIFLHAYLATCFPFLPGSSECQLLIPHAEGQNVPPQLLINSPFLLFHVLIFSSTP